MKRYKKTQHFYQQRRRWLSAQYYSFFEFANHLLPAIRDGKSGTFCDKALPTNLLLQGVVAGVCICNVSLYIYWASGLVFQVVDSVWDFIICFGSSHSTLLLDTTYV